MRAAGSPTDAWIFFDLTALNLDLISVNFRLEDQIEDCMELRRQNEAPKTRKPLFSIHHRLPKLIIEAGRRP
jgi:hypothetical protein